MKVSKWEGLILLVLPLGILLYVTWRLMSPDKLVGLRDVFGMVGIVGSTIGMALWKIYQLLYLSFCLEHPEMFEEFSETDSKVDRDSPKN